MRALLLLLALASAPALAQNPNTDPAAYRALFSVASLGVTNPPDSLLMGWTQHYRGAVPNSAFALAQAADGRTVWQFVGGRASPEEARAGALEGCTRSAAGIGAPPCRVIATNGTVEGRAPFTPSNETIARLRASPLHFHHGPQRAQGVLVYSHGRSGQGADLRNSHVQGWVSRFNDAGWDVLRFDRDPNDDATLTSLAQLNAALPELRQRGYGRIVLAGQSRGAWHSLLAAAERPELIDAVLAIAPAAHGNSGAGHNAALDEWRRIVVALPAERVRIATVLFREDAFDPLPSARIERLEAQAARRRQPTLIISPARGPADHGGGTNWQFTRDWSACLLAFVRDATPPTGTLREDCGDRR